LLDGGGSHSNSRIRAAYWPDPRCGHTFWGSALDRLPQGHAVITNGVLGVLWTALGLGCFYIGLTWINGLLGHFLTPMFLLTASRFLKPEQPDATADRESAR
jgi:hypothetical protein